MRKNVIILVLSILLFWGVMPVYAQSPTPTPGGNLPYDFQPYEYEKGGSPVAQFNIFNNPDFINAVGSTTLTVFTFFDDQNVLGIFVVILLGLWLLWYIAKLVFSSPSKGPGRLAMPSEGEEGDTAEEYVLERKYSSNPYQVYTQKFRRRR